MKDLVSLLIIHPSSLSGRLWSPPNPERSYPLGSRLFSPFQRKDRVAFFPRARESQGPCPPAPARSLSGGSLWISFFSDVTWDCERPFQPQLRTPFPTLQVLYDFHSRSCSNTRPMSDHPLSPGLGPAFSLPMRPPVGLF